MSLTDFNNIRFSFERESEIQEFINAEAGSELNLSVLEINKFQSLKAEQESQQQRVSAEKISGLFGAIKRKIAYKIMISGMENIVKKLHVCRSPV